MAKLAPDVQFYELMLILSPELSDVNSAKKLSEIKSAITSSTGKLTKEDIWGVRDLTFRIKRQEKGFYVILNFSLENGKEISELTKMLFLDNAVLRHMIMKTSADYIIKTLKEYQAEAKEIERLEAKEAAEEKKEKEQRVAKKTAKKKEEIEKKPIKKVKEVKEDQRKEEKIEEKPAEKAEKAKPSAKEELDELDEKLKKIMDNPDITI